MLLYDTTRSPPAQRAGKHSEQPIVGGNAAAQLFRPLAMMELQLVRNEVAQVSAYAARARARAALELIV